MIPFIKKFLNTTVGTVQEKALNVQVEEKSSAIQTLLGVANPSVGDTANVMGFAKLIYNQLGQDDPVSADRTSVMNYLRLLESNSPKDSSAFTPGIRAYGLALGATSVGLKNTNDTLVMGAVEAIINDCETVSGWSFTAGGAGGTIGLNTSWKTQGANSCTISSAYSPGYPAQYTASASMSVDCSGKDYIALDLLIDAATINGGNCKLKFDGATVATYTTSQTLIDVLIPVAGLSGVKTLTLEATVTAVAIERAARISVDNVRTQVSNKFGYLLKSMPCLPSDRLLFPPIFKPANTKCQVDVCGASIRANTAVGGATDYITLDASASAVDDFYNGNSIILKTGTGAGQKRVIVDYVGSTKRAYVTGDLFSMAPVSGTTFEIFQTIATNVSPGYDLKLISYVTHPTLNIIASLEKQSGATASPSMGIPIVTSIEKDWVSQEPAQLTNTTTTYATILNVSGKCKIDGINGTMLGSSALPILRIVIDGVVYTEGKNIWAAPALNQPLYTPLVGIECNNSLLVELRSAAANASGAKAVVYYSK